MKKKQTDPAQGNRIQKDKSQRPENKDNLDSRQNEEQQRKGDDMTHNRKEVKSERPSQQRNQERRGRS